MRPLATTVIGSYPQPDWLIDREKLAGRLPPRVPAHELWRVDERGTHLGAGGGRRRGKQLRLDRPAPEAAAARNLEANRLQLRPLTDREADRARLADRADAMPELHSRWGYPGALLAMATVSGVVYWRLKRAGWL